MRHHLVVLPSSRPEDRPQRLRDLAGASLSRTSRLRGSKLWFVAPGAGPGRPARLAGAALAPEDGDDEPLGTVWLEPPLDLTGISWLTTLLAAPFKADQPVLIRSYARQRDLEHILAKALPRPGVVTEPPPADSEQDLVPPGLVAEYLAGLPASVAILEAALEQRLTMPAAGDRTIRRLAHQFRGSGSSYGFPEITRLATATETASPESLPDAAGRLIDLLRMLGSSGTSLRALVVEDDRAMARLLEAHLARVGLTADTSRTAAEADRLVRSRRYDLVLLDLVLSDDDGRHLLARWRADPATRAMPIYVLSARLGAEVQAECLRLGAEAYFEKPIDGRAIAAAVVGRLQRKAGQSEPASPLPQPSPRPVPASEPEAPAARAARILLAEDDPMVASIVKHRLGKAGHRVEHVTDGTEALRVVEEPAADLVILDIKMPGVDGLQVLRHLRSHRSWQRVPVIILTALGNEEDLERGFGFGADDYLTKPFSPTELAVRVERLLRRA